MTTRDSILLDQPIDSRFVAVTFDPPWSKHSCHRSTRKYTTMPLISGEPKKGGYELSNEQESRTDNNKPA